MKQHMTNMEFRWRIVGYGRNHRVLLETVHDTEASRDVEIAAWRQRLSRDDDEASMVEVIDRHTGRSRNVLRGAAIRVRRVTR